MYREGQLDIVDSFKQIGTAFGRTGNFSEIEKNVYTRAEMAIFCSFALSSK